MYPQNPQQNQTPQPYFQPQAPQGPQQNPYDFILNPEKPKRPSPFTNSSLITKIIIGVGVIVFVVLVFAIIANSRASSGIMPKLVSVVQQQNEIVRVCDRAASASSNQSVRNFAINTKYVVKDQQAALQAYMKDHGKVMSPQELGLKRNNSTDTKLSAAAAASEYDQTFKTLMQIQLKSYQQSLSVVYKETTVTATKNMLKQDFDDTQLLINQSNVGR